MTKKQKHNLPEALINHACGRAYRFLRAHYGADPNDQKNPQGVEQAIRRDVIYVLQYGRTAKGLHREWRARKIREGFARIPQDSLNSNLNTALNTWNHISQSDRDGYEGFVLAVIMAQDEYYSFDPAERQRRFPEKPFRVPGHEPAKKSEKVSERLDYAASVGADMANRFRHNLFQIGTVADRDCFTKMAQVALDSYNAADVFEKYNELCPQNDVASTKFRDLPMYVKNLFRIFTESVYAAATYYDACTEEEKKVKASAAPARSSQKSAEDATKAFLRDLFAVR